MSDRVTAWYEAYGTELFGWIYAQMSGHPDAEDIHATVFLEACQKADSLDDTPRGWLYQAARWRVIDWRRRQRRWHMDALEDVPSEAMEDKILDRVVGQTLWETTTQLTPSQRVAFWQVYAEDRPIVEVAQWMGRSQSAVKGLLHRARVQLCQNITSNSAPI